MVTLGARLGLNVPVVVGAFTIGGRKKKCVLPGTQVPVAVRQFAWFAPSEISAEMRPPCDGTGRSLLQATSTNPATATTRPAGLIRPTPGHRHGFAPKLRLPKRQE